ncbi:hypothetical protein NFI96_005478, partial [Prochilodus magdalenae]
ACDLTLDPKTAHRRLALSEGNRKVANAGEDHPYPDHPDRFEHHPQVLSVESLTGRCYWEAEWSGDRVIISVSYRGINRKGDSDSLFGNDDGSWSLDSCNNSYSVCHNNIRTALPDPPCHSSTVGVYVDYEAGTLSFYSVSPDTQSLTHMHTFNTVLTEPLYAGLWRHSHRQMEGNGNLHQVSHQPMDEVLHGILERHKASMKCKYESISEGIKTKENKTLLNRIYTQLYVTEGESGGVEEGHEVLQMEKKPRKTFHGTLINCLDIFQSVQGSKGAEGENRRAVMSKGFKHRKLGNKGPGAPHLRTVLTKGIAGIGKTVSVQKFILDWAEGKANQDVELMFVLPFRELNLIKDDPYSLHDLLCDLHPEIKDLDPKMYDQIKAVFIFDGLDESRIPLDFEECEKVSDITMTSSVGLLMTNLIKGELLPSALIWITSRPAAANQIPPQYINRVTEIQGFSDPQKEEYFRRRISDEDQAERIISHIKRVKSLHIMCHIPVFCWTSATVLQQIMKQGSTEIPRTLTEMYSHFLLTQTHMKNEKYEEEDETDPKNLLESNRTVLLKLAELAFKQLMKGNVMFYEEDLRESRIDATEASVYSGIFTEIFCEESVLHQRKVYCFIHLSFQEFLAAVYVFHCYESRNMEDLQGFKPQHREWSENVTLDELLEGAVDKALENKNGNLDCFLRFLLGISLESNQRLLQGLLTNTHSGSEKTAEYIRTLIRDEYDDISTESSINLFLCLSEMNDLSLSREIQEYLRSEKHSEKKLSPGQCSALTYMLLNSEDVLDELNLNKYNTSEEGYKRLIPAVSICKKAILVNCYFIKDAYEILYSALQSANSTLKELDLSNSDLQDSGVDLLCDGVRSCKLEILRLAGCNLTPNTCEKFASALQSANSSLKLLDLSKNDLQDSGVGLLSAGMKSSYCKLEVLRKKRAGSPVPSRVPKKRCRSSSEPIIFSSEGEASDSGLQIERPDSPGSSTVSMKSGQSMGIPLKFSSGGAEPSTVSMKSGQSMGIPLKFSSRGAEPSTVSMKSDQSMGIPLKFSSRGAEPSTVSMKSDQSMGIPLKFSSGGAEPSTVSMKSDQSMGIPFTFSSGGAEPSTVSMKSDQSMGIPLKFSSRGAEPSTVSMKSDQSMGIPLKFSSRGAEPSTVSMKSDQSMGIPLKFSSRGAEPSTVSMKSDQSMGIPFTFSSGGAEPSTVSMKSDQSMGIPFTFSSGGAEPSTVSMKSDQSMGIPLKFSSRGAEPSTVSMKSDQSMGIPFTFSSGGAEPSTVSMKSDQSMGIPLKFSSGGAEPSTVSMKSDQSMGIPLKFSSGGAEPSTVSMKSDQSMGIPLKFSSGGAEPSTVSMKSHQSMGIPLKFSSGGAEPSTVSMKSDQSMGIPLKFSSGVVPSDTDKCSTEETLQAPTPTLVSGTGDLPQGSRQTVEDVLQRVLRRHKTSMKNKFENLFEGIKTERNKTLIHSIYIQLYIIEGESEGVNTEHEVLQVRETSRKHLQDTPINCVDILKTDEGETKEENLRNVVTEGLKHKEHTKGSTVRKLRTVLTKGIAGIGKTVSVQKFILDWAEGKANQDVEFMFVLPFRELNLIKDDPYSLHGLLCDLHPEIKDLDPKMYDQIKGVFIFDGLDESRIPLDFEECEKVSDITMTSSVGVLMTNLIKGELLPSALIWITSRPAAANQIPPEYINRVTEIQGFSDPQKEEYFRRRISNEDQAERIISHIKRVKSLHIMCHIPVFCWISATVLQQKFKQCNTSIPKTLTEMYSHFLLTQANVKYKKYEESDERDSKNLLESNRTVLLKLAELAFKQLMKGNVMFYEEDLRESRIDVTEASVYSGIFTEIFCEESVLHQRKVNCFIHLSFQEFLAAVYVFHCYESRNMEDLQGFKPQHREWSENVTLDELLEGAVDKALENKNGNLDCFLRFLLGISLESNQRLLQGLLTQPQSKLGDLTLACILLISEEALDDLDLKKYNTSEEGYKRLIPVLSISRKAILAGCNLTKDTCETLSSALQTPNSFLKELDLSNNDLQDSGVELLCVGLRSSHCKLVTLRLENGDACDLTLDPKTAHRRLALSEGNRKVANAGEDHPYPDHPDRFEHHPQVLSVESLTGRCYWEAEWSGDRVIISVSYRGINRKGDSDSLFGNDDGSWSLDCCNNSYSVCHNNIRTALPDPPCRSSTVGVYVDYEAGTLSFYSVSPDTQSLTHMHTFNTELTEPLYAGLWRHSHRQMEGNGNLHQVSHQPMNEVLHGILERHKASMKCKYESISEGIKTKENKTLLNRIYTQLYVTEGESGGVEEGHEVLQMEKKPRKTFHGTLINCLDIFQSVQGSKGAEGENRRAVMSKGFKHRQRGNKGPGAPHLRTVLTKGIAGIGKTVSVQKFILDWAEGKANQDVELMFVLPFRELNLIKDDPYSLHDLLCDLHPEIKDLDPKMYDQIKAVFIFDGLDESRIPLDFEECEEVSDITMTSSVGVLMANLIRGKLLPSALIWITSRPAAANQIPPQYINRVTEIQGFSDPQKEEYFRRRISDEDQAERIISHIKRVRSLHIMCHIPVFCWTSATVLQQIMKQGSTEIPRTLTEMYSHFLLTQTHLKNEKYEEEDETDPKNLLESNRTVLLKLAELAFKQLMKGNVMFYEEDLRESRIDATEASVYSGIFTEIFCEESVLHQRKVYCFIHLSFQEFLAAVYVFHCYESRNMEDLQGFKPQHREWSENVTLDELLEGAVDKALDTGNGHLDLFLRFLLGVSLESNQRLLQGLLTQPQSSSGNIMEYIKQLVRRDEGSLLTDRSINLLLCLSEINDQSLIREVQEYLRTERNLSPAQCSVLAHMLLIADEVLDELDMKKVTQDSDGWLRLVPAVSLCRKALLDEVFFERGGFETVCSAIESAACPMKELNLSNGTLLKQEVELLSTALRSSHCKLEILRLVTCDLGGKACEYLGSVLQSANSLKELDLSNNDLQDSGAELLSVGLKSSHCTLEALRLSGCMVTDEGCSSLASALKSNPSYLRELDLTYNYPGDSGVKQLSDLLEDPHCRLEVLRVEYGGEIRLSPAVKKYASELTLNPDTATRLPSSVCLREQE